MHDPMTVAHEIRRPWPSKKDGTYYPSLITIWHVDPETDGSDDSCGWSRPHLTDKERKLVDELVDWEERWPYYFKYPPTPGTAVALVFSLFYAFAWRLERRNIQASDLVTIFELAATEGNNVTISACGGRGTGTRAGISITGDCNGTLGRPYTAICSATALSAGGASRGGTRRCQDGTASGRVSFTAKRACIITSVQGKRA